MALGSKKSGSSKSDKKSGKGKKESSYRTVGSIWENEIETKNGSKTILNFNVDNQDPDDEYHQGTLLWVDQKSGKTYKVKSMNVFDTDKGPKSLLNKLSIDLNNEYHVEELEAE